MKELYVYGDIFDRFEGPTRFEDTLDVELMTEGHHLWQDREKDGHEALDEWMERLDNGYSYVQAIFEVSVMEEADRLADALQGKQVEVYVEDLVFGVGSTKNEAKLAYLEATNE